MPLVVDPRRDLDRSPVDAGPREAVVDASLLAGASARWIAETVRLYRRYEEEIVEGCELCPWSSRARRDHRVAERVLLQDEVDSLGPSMDAIQALAAENIDIGLLIYPRL